MRYWIIVIFLSFINPHLYGGCDDGPGIPLSPRTSMYKMNVNLDHVNKKAKCRQELTWVNHSPDTVFEMRFYMYLNAFKNMESSFLKRSRGNFFGQDLSERSPETWGWIEVVSMVDDHGNQLHKKASYIQPDDKNQSDQSVLSVPLPAPLLPGDSIRLEIHFMAKLPKTIIRAGYSRDDFFLFVHWFPQPGVYEKDENGQWGWNCHQFVPGTEFYADFGNYEVDLTVADHLVIGATGCRLGERINGDGTKTISYVAEDVIDFAWVAYPHFDEYIDSWNHVDIRILIPPEHCMLADRYLDAVKKGLEFMTHYVGEYPYPSLTVVDPPIHALRSGFMEYPMLITCGSFYRMPGNIRTLESLIIHEFCHQYFMATVASNEKEEPWLDEGLVTFFEDKIMDHYYGENSSLFDILGYRSGNSENSRLEYTRMPNPGIGPIARPGWEFTTGYKGLVYSKTASTLKTVEGLLGSEVMVRIMQSYFRKWKFRHPRGKDFISIVNEIALQEEGNDMQWLFDQCLYGTGTCDYRLNGITNIKPLTQAGFFGDGNDRIFRQAIRADHYESEVVCERLGELIFPQEILVTFQDGSSVIEHWDGKETLKTFSYSGRQKVISAHIDPSKKIYLDVDFNNNSLTLEPNRKPCLKYTTKAIHWLQNILQFSSILM